jgi:hypothetical protein
VVVHLSVVIYKRNSSPFGGGVAGKGQNAEEQTEELNKRLRFTVAERDLKAMDPGLAEGLGTE